MKLHRNLLTSALLAACLALPVTVQAQAPEDLDRIRSFLALMQDYFGIIESTHVVASNPEMSAIMQMQKMQEIYENRGEKAKAVEVFRRVLKETSNPTIRNAAYMLISDSLKDTGRTDEAIALLNTAIAENLKSAR